MYLHTRLNYKALSKKCKLLKEWYLRHFYGFLWNYINLQQDSYFRIYYSKTDVNFCFLLDEKPKVHYDSNAGNEERNMYSNEQLCKEASSCLGCRNAQCQKHCPISTDIPQVIDLFKQQRLNEAGQLLFENNPFSLVCAYVCDHASQCNGHCIKGIKSEPVKFFEIEKAISSEFLWNHCFLKPNQNGKRIAIIGGGPAGITVAFLLAKKGYEITIFDSHERLGGVLRYGIPEVRLPKKIVDRYEEILRELGVMIRPNTLIGPVLTLDRLLEDGYDAAFIGTGVWNPKTLKIKGETRGFVHYAIDYLKSPQFYQLGKKVLVIGAGNVAMDAARTAKQLGSEVTVVYRKSFDEMTATRIEIKEAQEEGVRFELYHSPVEITNRGVIFEKTEIFIDDEGKKQFKTIPDSQEEILCDSVIIAVSQSPKSNIVSSTQDLTTNKWGLLVIDEKGNTSKNGVFASGDVVTGAKTVVHAIAHAKTVADTIDCYCQNK